MRPRVIKAAAMAAPVDPAATTASAWPSFTRRKATVMLASFFWRRAVVGVSSMPITSEAWMTERPKDAKSTP
ncbi:hypothetical protein D3C87_2127000 [compost metagenome]